LINEVGGHTATWHNGGTGGCRSWLGVDREARKGVVVLTATSASVDRQGFRLLLNAPRSIEMEMLGMRSVVEQRYLAVREVSEGAKIVDVAVR
jgi:CubicO group peptidase (beta-lactamase class C family)